MTCRLNPHAWSSVLVALTASKRADNSATSSSLAHNLMNVSGKCALSSQYESFIAQLHRYNTRSQRRQHGFAPGWRETVAQPSMMKLLACQIRITGLRLNYGASKR